jgi:hypothetical protein
MPSQRLNHRYLSVPVYQGLSGQYQCPHKANQISSKHSTQLTEQKPAIDRLTDNSSSQKQGKCGQVTSDNNQRNTQPINSNRNQHNITNKGDQSTSQTSNQHRQHL